MRLIIVTLILCIVHSLSFAQDLIIKKDSTKIYCWIISVDSVTIQFYSAKEKNSPLYYIDRVDVLKYINGSNSLKPARLDTAERIYRAKNLKKGVYKNYQEYISNSPAFEENVAAIERDPAELTLMHGSKYAYSINGKTTITSSNYGFCDGKNAYVNYDHPKGFCKIDHIGPYSIFTYVVHGMGAYSLIPDQLMLIDPKGEFRTATVKNVKKILKQENMELFQKYEAETEQRDKRTDYILQLNQYLMSKK